MATHQSVPAVSATATRHVHGVCPLDCPDTCSWVVTVKDGRAVKLLGNREHPYTRGALCEKVNRYLEHTRQPDRLLWPMRRTGKKGEGRFARISWDEALGETAARWRAIIERDGPQAIWPYYGTGTLGMIQGLAGAGRRLWNVLGTTQHHLSICMSAGGFATGYTLGDNRIGMDPEGIAEAALVILWGANPLVTHHHIWKFVEAARTKGGHVVVIDPVRTRSADQADEHLAPRPGTDAALALGLLHVVVARGAEDREFIEAHTLGWDAFRARIEAYSPARVAEITGLPVDRIEALGERLATARPTAIRIGPGMQRHAGGGMAVRAITCIPGVTGDWRYPGGGAAYDTRSFFKGNWPALWRDDLRPPGTRVLTMTRLAEALLTPRDQPVHALLVYGSNPAASAPDQGRVRQGLAREDLFTVVIDHFQTDTADFADLLLPATMQTEHADLHHAYGHVYLAWNAPAVAAPGECLSNSEIFRRLARALRVTEPCVYDSDEDLARAVLDGDELRLAGITLETLAERGWMRLGEPQPWAPLAKGFPSPSGRLEFYSERAAAAGLDPLPTYTPPYEAVAADADLGRRFPLALIAPAGPYFLNTEFSNLPALRDKAGPQRVLLHADDAAPRELSDGDVARVFNARGEYLARVEISDRVPPGIVGGAKGHWPKLNPGGTSIAATVMEKDADMGRGAVFHDNRVEVERASVTREDFLEAFTALGHGRT
ncbi:MAG TPA: molybdopterin-dependent oxidoreductase [Candidatus Bathyarchaeia archaeon]|nr:molybdopterin-dependent oxidoreductase [Candidatus Bathyarchaeia archaeon]